ncbi:MAG TPA: rod-binding protein [Hyphomonadaceae bacterium]|jgi:Rod binding domain-containing protein|nr:rod-binding protein [Hyphomonadaceae bacterium]
MVDVTLPQVPADTHQSAVPSIAGVKTRQQAEAVAEQFERMFVSEMLKPMFEGIKTDGMFGGGNAEDTFRPMLLDQYADGVAKSGGVGIKDAVLKEILRMQGLE